jgi:two-component system aerobic respiration control sensor histidine kinase ArcB
MNKYDNGILSSAITVDSDNFFENIIALLPGHIYWKDLSLRFLGCNDNQAEIAGLKHRKDIVGLTAYDIIDSNLSNEVRAREACKIDEIDKEVIRNKVPITIEEPWIDHRGNQIVFLSQKIPLVTPEGDAIGLLGISIDITMQKNNEKKILEAKKQAEQAIKTKNQFLYNMRHDIRTPFSGILGLSRAMADHETDLEKKQNLHEISNSAGTLLEYLNGILEFTQIDSGNLPVLYKSFNAEKMLIDSINTFKPAAKQKNIDLSLNYNLPKWMICDQSRIQRILINLLSNSVKFTYKGAISVEANIISQKQREALVALTISDTGIGIPQEKQSIIFEKFSKVSTSYTSDTQGMGLGLKAVSELISDLDGEIVVESDVDKGSCFTCIIPMKIPIVDAFESNHYSELEEESEIKLLKEKSKFHKMSVLLVEDSRIAQLAVTNLLQGFPIEIEIAETGTDAMKKFYNNSYDLVLLDIGLPDINGYVVAEEIRSFEKSSARSRVPIIVVTAHADEDAIHSNSRIIDDTVIKPMTKDAMTNILNIYTE